MNLGILEGLQAHGTNSDTTCMEMLPGNHKDELPLIHFVPTLPHHFCCPVFILIYLFLFLSSLSVLNFLPPHGSASNRLGQVHCSLWPEMYYFLSQALKLKGLHYPGKLEQCTTTHFPGAYLGINVPKSIRPQMTSFYDSEKHGKFTKLSTQLRPYLRQLRPPKYRAVNYRLSVRD